ncbi:MAG: hypothetical protein PSY14_13820 [bacterium]|nr:hypothetical protein [bacterium]
MPYFTMGQFQLAIIEAWGLCAIIVFMMIIYGLSWLARRNSPPSATGFIWTCIFLTSLFVTIISAVGGNELSRISTIYFGVCIAACCYGVYSTYTDARERKIAPFIFTGTFLCLVSWFVALVLDRPLYISLPAFLIPVLISFYGLYCGKKLNEVTIIHRYVWFLFVAASVGGFIFINLHEVYFRMPYKLPDKIDSLLYKLVPALVFDFIFLFILSICGCVAYFARAPHLVLGSTPDFRRKVYISLLTFLLFAIPVSAWGARNWLETWPQHACKYRFGRFDYPLHLLLRVPVCIELKQFP